MKVEEVIYLNQELFTTALLVALPALAISLIIGVVVSILQTITSIQDQTLTYVPRILLVGLTIVLTMGFSLQLAIDFAQRMIAHAAGVNQ